MGANMNLKILFLLSTLFAVSSALNCTQCSGGGTKCAESARSERCPPAGDAGGRCGRVTFVQNGISKVVKACTRPEFCIGPIDCLKDGFELGKRYKNATNCVLSCCNGDNCNAQDPLQCNHCQGKVETCKTNMISCKYEEDRCLRINYKVGDQLMTDQRCYKSTDCSNTTEICDLVKKNNSAAKECKPTCCNQRNCNAEVKPRNSNSLPIGSCILIGSLLQLVSVMLYA